MFTAIIDSIVRHIRSRKRKADVIDGELGTLKGSAETSGKHEIVQSKAEPPATIGRKAGRMIAKLAPRWDSVRRDGLITEADGIETLLDESHLCRSTDTVMVPKKVNRFPTTHHRALLPSHPLHPYLQAHHTLLIAHLGTTSKPWKTSLSHCAKNLSV
ncbi:uncharacterized protein SPPG_04042 [Spizellomyces punctatus DAOM BR117]|uniref:Uncharacterized protein n=1 Tax=Spizellomyces punctatus (strain DAOM BR117) TaxID=645134 RepID=A0A0L0HHJ8_SPIPD|nr:uncharacterized protein SPPG_04042 [Spizellomyces punctatus DAOM BR117]KND00941.1 hypothetical protein SPPG_04042 [Spizellomyces punctatus DAOM BR117]|eukprot:XP_016608980.1 hypothetical protein SPPG_04042 [Spizellomyces punctatus DAOM BR117]